MNYLAQLLRCVRLFLSRDRATRELEQEMELHRLLRAKALETRGMTTEESQHAAHARFGNALRTAERSRDAWGWGSLDEFRQDVRYAARRLLQRPGFAASVIGVLALGIGATTAMFSAVDAAMLKPLPFLRPNELVTLPGINVPFDWGGRRATPETSFDITNVAAMSETFSSVAAYASGGLNLADQQQPLRINAGVVSATFFATLGVSPAKGRTFLPDDGKPGAPNVAVISWGLWQRQFGGSDVIGSTIPLSARSYQIVGVMPKGFSFPSESDLWIPMSIPSTPATFEAFRGWLSSTTVARVAPGVEPRAAKARLMARWEQFISGVPHTPGKELTIENSFKDARRLGIAIPLHATLVGDRKRALLVLLGATGLLLLIACVNVTNLLLSHGAARQRELAVRSVLGATRPRVVRQLVAESVLLSSMGAIAGLALAPLVLWMLRALMPSGLAGVAPPHLDLRVLAFATALGLLTGIAFGLWPAFGATRISAGAAIKAGGGRGASAARTRHVQHWLVGAELALTVMLLVGAGLMLRSFERLVETDAGIHADQTATLELSFARGSSPPGTLPARVDAILERVRTTPGITSAGAINDLPLRGEGGIAISVQTDNGGVTPKEPFVRMLIASEDYFTTMGIALRRGRFFSSRDDASAPKVAIINEAMAKAFWPDRDPVGQTFHWGGDTASIHVVGVVADVRESGLERESPTQMFFPMRTNAGNNLAVVARGTVDARTLLAQLTAAVRAVDPAQAVHHVRMMNDVIDASAASRRANTLLISLFSGLALVVSVLGVYAVTAYAVAQRSREFGIRSALGATGRQLIRHVGAQMIWVALAGVTIGGMLAWALSRVMSSLLYGVTTHDPATFVAAPLLLVFVTLLAALIPARRALRVNPADVMRED